MDDQRALKNRFRVIYGAQSEMEVMLCAGITALIPPISLSIPHEELRDQAVVSLLEYVVVVLLEAGVPAPRVRTLLKGIREEIGRRVKEAVEGEKRGEVLQ